MPVKKIRSHLGIAWIMLCFSLLIHVIDEALHDFLAFYNPIISRLKEHIPFLPFPNFTFQEWLTGLVLAVILLFLLSRYAFRETGWIIHISFLFGSIMFLNGLLHIFGSVYFNLWVPGVYSSWILLISSAYLIWSAYKLKSQPKAS